MQYILSPGKISSVLVISLILIFNSCITEFIPQSSADEEIIVIEGLLTDQPVPNKIKISHALRLGVMAKSIPVRGCIVTISDDQNNITLLKEADTGTYVTDPAKFQGQIGRFYTLHVRSNAGSKSHVYESYPVELLPVPAIDSLYYEKVELNSSLSWIQNPEGCQIFLDTHDPTNQCNFYRWEFEETWEFRVPYSVPNNTCWATSNSNEINVKSTSKLADSKIIRYPLSFISNQTDRLKVKYSSLVTQYSISEDEYNYWSKLQSITQQVGGLYDIIPFYIASNIYCKDNADLKVLGYFSVSSAKSKRIFVKDNFRGLANPYSYDACIADTVWNNAYIPNLNISVWVLIEHSMPDYKVITYTKGCADCTTRGTLLEPAFWHDGK
jgi:hypothetical protein